MDIAARREMLIKRTFVDYKATSEFLENPLIFERAEGPYLWDVNGKRYFDAIGDIFARMEGRKSRSR
jgi:4-aminobutyrate aminotransferase-like enzyme